MCVASTEKPPRSGLSASCVAFEGGKDIGERLADVVHISGDRRTSGKPVAEKRRRRDRGTETTAGAPIPQPPRWVKQHGCIAGVLFGEPGARCRRTWPWVTGTALGFPLVPVVASS